VILHPLYRDGTSINMNLEKWNSLTPEVQEIVLEAVRETQEWAPGWVSEVQASQLAAMKDGGMSTIEFSPEEAERWRETADAALWQHFESVMSPDEYATARKLLEAE
jgi:TRAP-type C4-dicarboxylate transport system substrate-binding protein